MEKFQRKKWWKKIFLNLFHHLMEIVRPKILFYSIMFTLKKKRKRMRRRKRKSKIRKKLKKKMRKMKMKRNRNKMWGMMKIRSIREL